LAVQAHRVTGTPCRSSRPALVTLIPAKRPPRTYRSPRDAFAGSAVQVAPSRPCAAAGPARSPSPGFGA
jgi:hypothetical protein